VQEARTQQAIPSSRAAGYVPRQADAAAWPISVVRAHPLALIIVSALLVRFALTPLYAYLPDGALDEGYWKYWMYHIQDGGFLNVFRTTETDYVGYHWVLWPLAGFYGLFSDTYNDTTPLLHVLVKMPSIAFDVALIFVVYHATRMLVMDRADGEKLALVAAAAIAFHPAVVYDSAVWAQTDSAIAAAMLGAIVLAYRSRPALAGASYTLGLAVKPHPVIIGPLLLLAVLRHGGVRAALLAGAAIAVVAALVLGPWIAHGELGRIVDIYQGLFTRDYHRLSELAWNGWHVFDYAGDPGPGSSLVGPVTFRLAGLALSACAAVLAIAYAAKRPGLHYALIAAAYQAFAFYALPIGTHERYLYPLFAFLLPVAVIDRRWLWLYVPLSATFFLNLVVVAPPIPNMADRWVYTAFGPSVAVVNMALFAAFTAVLVRESLVAPRKRSVPHRSGQVGQS
jgi:Gpi18-like mannosyltransferase